MAVAGAVALTWASGPPLLRSSKLSLRARRLAAECLNGAECLKHSRRGAGVAGGDRHTGHVLA